jgi:hypothetical protein
MRRSKCPMGQVRCLAENGVVRGGVSARNEGDRNKASFSTVDQRRRNVVAISDDEALGDGPAKRITTKRHRISPEKRQKRPSDPNQDSNDIEQAVLGAESDDRSKWSISKGMRTMPVSATMNLFSGRNIHKERKEWSWRSARAVPIPKATAIWSAKRPIQPDSSSKKIRMLP